MSEQTVGNNSCACVLITLDEKVLAVSRKNDPTAFGLPGGKKEPNEVLSQTAIRETLEETGYHITIDPWNPFFDLENGVFCITYKAKIDTSKSQLPITEKGVVAFKDPQTLVDGPFGSYNKDMFDHFGIKYGN